MPTISQLPVLNDNYIYLVHDPDSGETAAVDPAVADAVLEVLNTNGWHLNFIFNTHHHWDHVGANLELKEKTGCRIIASAHDRSRIPGIDRTVTEGDAVFLGRHRADIMETPGHTLGHIVYYFAEDRALFCGDTLFVMGCGRLFEGTPEQMLQSLNKLKKLPEDTRVYCAHEYTQNNGRFALLVEPDNADLQSTMREVDFLRSQNRPTVPSTIGRERSTNPFFRTDCASVRNHIGMRNGTPLEVFAEIRNRKDRF
ncbi:MAG: hydroxyacylglutathione hydrolase [Gammaproteobacteria bacterium]